MRPRNIIADKTIEFSLSAIEVYKALLSEREYIISKQFLRSAMSIGANVQESISAESRKDFIHKMSISLKEARECNYWLIILEKSCITKLNTQPLQLDLSEIIKLLASIINTSKKRA